MGSSHAAAGEGGRLQRLLTFLDRDPQNLALLADCAGAALDEGRLETAAELIARYETLAAPSGPLLNLKGLVAIGRQDFLEAASIFERLVTEHPQDPAIRFNLAWARAMLGEYRGAFDLLDDATASASSEAASLKIQMLHHLGQLHDALACGAVLAGRYPDDGALMGHLATVALDAEDIELAKHYASRAGASPEGLAAAGMLMLNEDDVDGARHAFDKALGQRPDDARALIGKGLSLMAAGQAEPAAAALDKGAEAFGDHLGSWVAAGWAYFVQGDMVTSRARFETALEIDDTFAETHGALAVLDASEGQLESAARRAEVALRLDRNCLSAALAKSLLLSADGNTAAAERIQKIALNRPIGESGRTLAQAITGLGAATRLRG